MELSNINLNISPKGDSCFILIDDQFNKLLSEITKENIIDFLNKKNIIKGLLEIEIEKLLEGKHKTSEKVLVAERTKPLKGKAGYFQYLISTTSSIKEKDDGSVDFYEVGLIKNVKAGDRLVEIISPTRGKPGFDIFGNEIEGLYGDEANPKKIMGKGIKLSEDNRYLIAAIDGIYKSNVIGVISIDDQLVINSNIDFSTGNIDTSSSVYIKGDIKSGFKCLSNSSIKVDGAIEDAEVFSGDSLICKNGVISGTSPIIVKNTFRTKYITDRPTIECKDLFVEGMISNSDINCLGELNAGKISGGSIRVKDLIIVNDLGNERYDLTSIEVGLNYKALQRMDSCKQEEADLKKRIDIMKQDLENIGIEFKKISRRYNGIMENSGSKDMINKLALEIKENRKKESLLQTDIVNSQRKIDGLLKEYELLSKKVENTNPEIIVKGSIYPGVNIRLKLSARLEINEKMSNVKLILDPNSSQIRTVKI
ncbi:MAG: DUF342 domain-containing protein [Candidatus Delongbacteria bacterium]|nr:DUF342 domain-containing protein [Candidatus Delongbacteria bacterium]MBN2836770.1 DUF342 domain-containing protein [Candidatus Delongbacteria bacterium]